MGRYCASYQKLALSRRVWCESFKINRPVAYQKSSAVGSQPYAVSLQNVFFLEVLMGAYVQDVSLDVLLTGSEDLKHIFRASSLHLHLTFGAHRKRKRLAHSHSHMYCILASLRQIIPIFQRPVWVNVHRPAWARHCADGAARSHMRSDVIICSGQEHSTLHLEEEQRRHKAISL